MSYQVLARKWRPQSFKEMVGQEHVLKALINSLDQQRLHHAYLFTGTRGVGKTTIGRILAKCLNCDTGITSVPCGECGACREIADGRFVDLIEIDAASRTKVEDMRELLDNVQYSPTRGRFKVYLIDEVHMLSSSSFNALLKTLEEPPEHVKFLFATTDPQKLPVTILSRCLQFNLKNMPPERIVSHLKNVLGQEQINFEESALWLLARSADGSMRDALSLTDQAIAYGNHTLAEVDVSAMLGSIDQKQVYRIIEAVANSNAVNVLQEVASLSEFSPDYAAVLANVISVLHRVAVEQVVPGSTDNSMGDQEQVVALAGALTAEDVQLFYQVALMGRNDLSISPDQRAGLEMVLLRMLAFKPNIEQNIPKLKLVSTETTAPAVSGAQVEQEQHAPKTVEEHAGASLGEDDLTTDTHSSDSAKPVKTEEPTIAVETANSIEPTATIEPSATIEPASTEETVSEAEAVSTNEPSNDVINGLSDQPSQQEPPQGHPALDQYSGEEAYDASSYETYANQAAEDSMALDPEPITPQGNENRAAETAQKKTPDLRLDSNEPAPANALPGAQQNSQPSEVERTNSSPTKLEEVAPASTSINDFLTMENPWPHILPLLKLTGMTQNLAANTRLILEPSRAELCAEEGNFRLLTETHKNRIVTAFKQLFGDGFGVDFSQGTSGVETPAEWKNRKKEERLALAVTSIETDPNVVTLVNRFDATILTSTVEPID